MTVQPECKKKRENEGCGVTRPDKQLSVYEVRCMLKEGGLGGFRCNVALQVPVQPATFRVVFLLSPSAACCLIKWKCAEIGQAKRGGQGEREGEEEEGCSK